MYHGYVQLGYILKYVDIYLTRNVERKGHLAQVHGFSTSVS